MGGRRIVVTVMRHGRDVPDVTGADPPGDVPKRDMAPHHRRGAAEHLDLRAAGQGHDAFIAHSRADPEIDIASGDSVLSMCLSGDDKHQTGDKREKLDLHLGGSIPSRLQRLLGLTVAFFFTDTANWLRCGVIIGDFGCPDEICRLTMPGPTSFRGQGKARSLSSTKTAGGPALRIRAHPGCGRQSATRTCDLRLATGKTAHVGHLSGFELQLSDSDYWRSLTASLSDPRFFRDIP